MKINWRILVAGLAITIPLIILLYSGFGTDPRALPDERTGDPAPTFKLVDLEGKEWDLEQLRGKPVFVNFWSTWCGPCKMEHPMLLEAAKYYPNVQFVGVIYSDENAKVQRQMGTGRYAKLMADLKAVGIEYPNLDDSSGRTAIDYGVGGVPESFFIDRSGQIVYKSVGPLTADVLRRELDRIVRQ